MKKYIKMYLLALVGLLGVNNAIANNTLWETRSYKYPTYLVNPFSFKSSTFLFNQTIKANNDLIRTSKDGGIYSILGNDTFGNGLPGQGFVLTGTGKNTNISQEGTWPTGITINANGQLVIANNAAIPLGSSLEYKICTLTDECSSGFITFEIPIEGKTDSYLWNTSTTQYSSVVANDVFKVEHVVTPIVLSGTNKNVTISQNGTWPAGITLDITTGMINVTSGTTAPSSPLEYKICVDGEPICQNVKIVFLKAETPYSGWNPGSIKIDHQYVCYNGTAVIENEVMGVGSSLIGGEGPFSLLGRRYSWEISFDGGLTWTHTDDILPPPSNSDNEEDQSTSGSVGTITVDKGNSITITNVTNDFYVRRKANIYHITEMKRFNSYTAPVLVKAQKENEIKLPNDINSFALALSQSFTLPTVTTYYKSDIRYYRINPLSGDPMLIANPEQEMQLGEGTYEFLIEATTVATGGNASTVIAPRTGCVTTTIIKVMVYNAADCYKYTKRTFATEVRGWTSGLSGVASETNAINGNRANYATITGGVVILGIGTVGIDLYFTKLSDPNDPNSARVVCNAADLKGKKVVIKLGEQYSGLKLAGGLSAVGRYTSATNPADIGISSGVPIGITNKNVGTSFGVKGGVLDLLKGDNVFEFSFIPATSITDSGTHVGYQGIRIQLGSLLGVADLATVFRAYVEEDYTVDLTVPCEDRNPDIIVNPPASLQYPSTQKGFSINNNNIKLNPYVQDVTWGNYTEVLNVASGLSSVTFPYYAVDENYNSYAIFNTTAGVLNKQFLKVKLRRQARPGDQIQLVLGTEGVNILNLGLLNLVDYKVKFFKGDQEVGNITLDRFKVLDLGLLRFEGEQRAIISAPVSGVFDYVQLEQWNTVNVNLGNQLHVYDIRVNPTTMLSGQSDSKTLTDFCATDYLKLRKSDFCSDYEVSFAIATFADGQEGRPLKRLKDESNADLIDQYGNPMFELYDVADISDSSLGEPFKIEDNIAYYKFTRLFSEVGNNLLVKIQTKRQGCNYGDPQYLRANLKNCEAGMINPVINSGVKQ